MMKLIVNPLVKYCNKVLEPLHHSKYFFYPLQYNQESNPYPNTTPQHVYQEHHYNIHGGSKAPQHINGHHVINAEPSPRDSHADANEEIQGYFPTPLPRKPHTPSSYMNIPHQQQHGASR